MISRRRLIVAAVALFALPVGAVLLADRIGVDIGLVADRLVGMVKGAPEPQNEQEQMEAADLALKRDRTERKSSPLARDIPIESDRGPIHPRLPVGEKKDDEQASGGDSGLGGQPEIGAGEPDRPAETGYDEAFHRLPPGDAQPWRLYRSFQRLQDDILKGRPGALRAYREAIDATSRRLLAAPPDSWAHPRNVMAVAAYVFSGGSPEIAARLKADPSIDPPSRHLLNAADAFANGQYYRAYNLLYEIDPSRLPLSIAGQVALVRAMLASPRNLPQAREYLALARRLAPGTLTEEAAIRRQMQVLTELEEVEEFFAASESYMRRFPKSHYMADFLRHYSTGILKLWEGNGARILERLALTRAMMDADAGLYFFTLLARGATVFGRLELARLASENSMELVKPESRLAERLKLYRAASSLGEPGETDTMAGVLANIDSGKLGSEDRRLLAAARLVTDQIMLPVAAPIFDGADDIPPAEGAADAGIRPAGQVKLPPVLARAQNALRLADEMLGW